MTLMRLAVDVSEIKPGLDELMLAFPLKLHESDVWQALLDLWVVRAFMPPLVFEEETVRIVNEVLSYRSDSMEELEYTLGRQLLAAQTRPGQCGLAFTGMQNQYDPEELVSRFLTTSLSAILKLCLNRLYPILRASIPPEASNMVFCKMEFAWCNNNVLVFHAVY